MNETNNFSFTVSHDDEHTSFEGVKNLLKDTAGVTSVTVHPAELMLDQEPHTTQIDIGTELSETEALQLIQGLIAQCIGPENAEVY